MDILIVLENHRDKWGKMLNNMGCPSRFIEDIIQDTYIKISLMKNNTKILREDGDVNLYYVYKTIYSVFCDYMNKNKYVLVEKFEDNLDDDGLDIDTEMALMTIYSDILMYSNNFGSYGSKLCNLYLPTDRSLRQIAEGANISLTSIYNTIKKHKMELKEEFTESYEQYLRIKKGGE